jgi:hypothetical protein
MILQYVPTLADELLTGIPALGAFNDGVPAG